MNKLNPLTLSLDQNCLIEASAGTGKTYTITTLYLRALLGLLVPGEQLSPIDIKKILVVTFTDAATKELKDRIRTKLVESQRYIIAHQSGVDEIKTDPNLVAVINEYEKRCFEEFKLTPEDANLRAYTQIQNALLLIDESAIFTIHGFCQRCLSQFAFETQTDFEQHMEMEYLPSQQKALYDFWRRDVLALGGIEFSLFNEQWSTPEALLKNLSNVLGKPIVISPEVTLSSYQQQLNRYSELLNLVREKWNAKQFSDVITQSSIQARLNIKTKVSVLQPFLDGHVAAPEFSDKLGWHLWGSEMLHKQSNYLKNKPMIEDDIIALIDQLVEVESSFCRSEFVSYWLANAKNKIESLMALANQERQVITPDDLLTSMASALGTGDNSRLLDVIRSRYPLAFIDEFQDTDPIQYQIFSTLYVADKQLDCNGLNKNQEIEPQPANMVLIGDPKQAIYKFRGADIYTYIRAKGDVPETRHFTLDKNWRSHEDLIHAVNYLFENSPQQFEHKAIPFNRVSAGQSFKLHQTPINIETSVLEVMHLVSEHQNASLPEETKHAAEKQIDTDSNITKKSGGKTATKDDHVIGSDIGYETLAKWCALDIQASLANHGNADNKVNKPITTGDICVLVRSRGQAKIIKNCLHQIGLDSVYLSRESIFRSKIAKELYLVFCAICAPNREQTIKAALATQLFDLSVDELLALQHDPNVWQEKLNWFFDANAELQKGNVSSSVDHLLNQANSYAKWANNPQTFNRNVTDIRHLLEILQSQTKLVSGIEKLQLWFEQQLAEAADTENNEDKALRLESDSNLIKIVTYHASKGLEYPYVYLPFICHAQLAKDAVYTSESKSQTFFRADNREIELQQAEQERLAEDLRILYVCLTRPVYRIAIGLFNVKNRNFSFKSTAIARLLLGEFENQNADLLLERYFNDMASKLKPIETAGVSYTQQTSENIDDSFSQFLGQYQSSMHTSNEALELALYQPLNKNDWRMISYSMMSHQLGHSVADFDARDTKGPDLDVPVVHSSVDDLVDASIESGDTGVGKGLELEHDIPTPPSSSDEQEVTLDRFNFPKGANAGTCLHWILENLDFKVPVNQQALVIESGLRKFSIDLVWIDTLIDWMQAVIENKTIGFTLQGLSPDKYINELEFYFDFNGLSMDVIGNALSMMGLDELSVKAKSALFSVSKGVVKGFVDVVVQHEEKFYVVDYKSNFLGACFKDYELSAMHQNMVEHHYHLQALIYVLALHRFLSTKLNHYDYNRHIGDAVYMYLRGMDDCSDGGVYSISIKQDVIIYLDNALKTDQTFPVNNQLTHEKDSADKGISDNAAVSHRKDMSSLSNPETKKNMVSDASDQGELPLANEDQWSQSGFEF